MLGKGSIEPASQRPGQVALLAAGFLLLLATLVVAHASIGFALGRPVTGLYLGLGAVLAAVLIAILSRREREPAGTKEAVLAIGLGLLVACAAAPISGLVYDMSMDGQWYHLSGVLSLAGGWNPFAGPVENLPTTNALYVNHYAKGPWVLAAVVYRAVGRIEMAKAFNLILPCAAGLAVSGALRRTGRFPAWLSWLAGFLAAFNPVSLYQGFTFYVDGQLAALVTAAIAFGGAAVASQAGPIANVGLGAALFLLVNVKFTGVPYAVMIGAAGAGAAWIWRGMPAAIRQATPAALAVALGVLGAGWNPYVTNWRTKGHPLYPVYGAGAVDVMTINTPDRMRGRNRFAKLGMSILAVSTNFDGPWLKAPFVVRPSELDIFVAPDVRGGGFGVFFSGALALAAVLLAALLARARREALPMLALAGAILGSVLANPEGWWARYAPQLWLIPIALALAAWLAPRTSWRRGIGLLVLAVLVIDAALVLGLNLAKNWPDDAALRAQLRELAASRASVDVDFGAFISNRIRFQEAGVKFRETSLTCPSPIGLKRAEIYTHFCQPKGEGGRDR